MRRLLATALLAALAGCQSAPPSRTVVFFSDNSIALDENATVLVQRIAAEAQASPRQPVRVLGFASNDGDTAANRSLSRARAETVAGGLAAAGVPRDRIAVQPRGPVSFDQAPIEARRVEIVIGQ